MENQTKTELLEKINEKLAEKGLDVQAVLNKQGKMNEVIKEGITFMKKTGEAMVVSPVIYLSDYMDQLQSGQETDILDVAQEIVKIYEMIKTDTISDTLKQSFENVDKNRIVPQIINRDLNKEMLGRTPHRDISDDLAVIGRLKIADGTTVITSELAGKLKMTSSEVLEAAMSNGQGFCKPMYSVMAEIMEDMSVEQARAIIGDNGMYIVSNQEKLYGATAIYIDRNLRKDVAEMIGGDYYIIPSSIHETICISTDRITPEEANEMITEVNQSQLLPEEVLSNHCYKVNAETLKITNPLKETEKQTTKFVAGI